MIRCPKCKSTRLEVLGGAWDPNTEAHHYLRRRRRCKACRKTFHTREFPETDYEPDTTDIRLALSFLYKAAKTLTKGRKSKRIDE